MYIYIFAGYGYSFDGYFKVGISKHPKRRFAQINQGVPFSMVKLYARKCIDAEKCEAIVLAEFQRHRINGEWFYIQSDYKKTTRRQAQANNKARRKFANTICKYVDELIEDENHALL